MPMIPDALEFWGMAFAIGSLAAIPIWIIATVLWYQNGERHRRLAKTMLRLMASFPLVMIPVGWCIAIVVGMLEPTLDFWAHVALLLLSGWLMVFLLRKLHFDKSSTIE